MKRRVNTFGLNFGLYQGHIWPKVKKRKDRAMTQLSFDVIKRVQPKSGLVTLFKKYPRTAIAGFFGAAILWRLIETLASEELRFFG